MTDITENNPEIAAMPSDLKIRNRIRILGEFRSGRERTASGIAELTGISRQTVMKAIQFFMDRGLIVNTGKGDSTEAGGKKPELYAFSCGLLLVSVTMWPESLIVTLSDMNGARIGSVRRDWAIPESPKEAMEAVAKLSITLLAERGYTRDDIYGVTLSTAGTIDYRRGLLKYSSLSPGWGTHIPLVEMLRDIFGDRVIILENAGKMAGRSTILNPRYDGKRLLVLFSTWGFSACLNYNGHILSGTNSLIGEIGHMVVEPDDDEVCGCGSRGCFERMVSVERIRREIARLLPLYGGSVFAKADIGGVTIGGLFAASRAADPLAREVVGKLAGLFGRLLRNISLSFDPDAVIFTGDYSAGDEYFRERLKGSLSEFQYFPPGGAFEIDFDTRPLYDMDVIGSVKCLTDRFFGDMGL
jgi:predicted NBD/HSP70 family sugar kinase